MKYIRTLSIQKSWGPELIGSFLLLTDKLCSLEIRLFILCEMDDLETQKGIAISREKQHAAG